MRYILTFFALSLTGCVEEPTPKEAEAAAVMQADITPQKQLEADARSIEQAADEAVKLIEAEARVEVDQAASAAKQDP